MPKDRIMRVQWIGGKDKCRLIEPFNVRVCGVLYTIPAGFTWDGASIPNIFWSLLFVTPFHYTVRRAGLLHDYLYSMSVDRRFADTLFMKLMKEDGANWAQRTAMFLAVRAFGWAFHKGE